MEKIDLGIQVRVSQRHCRNGVMSEEELIGNVLIDDPGTHTTAVVYLNVAGRARRVGTAYLLSQSGTLIPDQLAGALDRYALSVYGGDILAGFRSLNESVAA